MERKIAELEGNIRGGGSARKLILNAVIGTGVEVATGAGQAAIAAGLNVPEQGLTQGDKGVVVLHVNAQSRRRGQYGIAQGAWSAAGASLGEQGGLR